MAIRTVRLDDEAEAVLREIQRATNAPISEVLKSGLRVLQDRVRQDATSSAYEVFRQLEPGTGGDAIAPATDVRGGVRRALRRKHGR
jgi:hypothetical protein